MYIYIYYSNMCIIYYTIKYKTEHIMWCISTVQKRSSQRGRAPSGPRGLVPAKSSGFVSGSIDWGMT